MDSTSRKASKTSQNWTIVLLIPLKPKRDPDAPLGSVPAELLSVGKS